MIQTILSVIFWIWIIQSAAVLLMYCRAMFGQARPGRDVEKALRATVASAGATGIHTPIA
jgi:hypothetical protein